MLAGAERIIEREFEEEFEKEFRNPALEDTSLNDASLNEASLRAFNARVHTSTLYFTYPTPPGGDPPEFQGTAPGW